MSTNEHLNQKPQQMLALEGKAQYYVQVLGRATLLPGLYRMVNIIHQGAYVPAFEPAELSNDKPLGIDDTINEIVKEMHDFMGRRPIFKKMGFAHKRGYLMHGPPGCGKSSTIRLLEEKFVDEFKGVVLFWSPGMNPDSWYTKIREMEPTTPVMLVCEDLENQLEYFEENILEFLDGQRGLDNFILVATTNNLDAIPSRLKDRPSRIDRLLEIGLPNLKTRLGYLEGVGIEHAEALDLAQRTNGLTIAQVKEVVVATVCLGADLAPVLKRLKAADMAPVDSSGEACDKELCAEACAPVAR